ncbi:unnamed protein product [Colletotrichum noveboracense]|uniref:Uncharacterized protein n=1 Tax=Colletotrichum noveboracense TaxID=2664923 RepID=A0A9W4WNI5_9PEZI|nr:unnamed protein product [Colletotrichum noveboracense]
MLIPTRRFWSKLNCQREYLRWPYPSLFSRLKLDENIKTRQGRRARAVQDGGAKSGTHNPHAGESTGVPTRKPHQFT